MKILVVIALLLVSISNHANGECVASPESLGVSSDFPELVSAVGKVLGVGDSSRVRKANDREYPFVGRFRGPGEHPGGCTGVILGKNIVLTAGHCVDGLGESPLFILSRDPYKTNGAAPAKLMTKGNDWAFYKLDSPIAYDGPYPKLSVLSIEELQGKPLSSIGFPLEGAFDFTNNFVVDEHCKVFNTTFGERKFLSNCFTREGTSGGPVGYFESGMFHIVAIRSGPQWGLFRRIFGQVGTVETPTSFFKETYEKLVNEM